MDPSVLVHEASGPYAELASRPNPDGFIIAFMPALGAWLLRAEREKGEPLTQDEVVRIRDGAPAIAIVTAQVEKLRESRGYEDVDPTDLWSSWQAFKTT